MKQQVIETKKFKQAVEFSVDGVIITDENSIILFVNVAWEKITGYNFADVKRLTPKTLQSGKTPRSVYKKMWANLKSGKAFISEDFINKRKDGEEYQVRSALYPLREKNKTLFYVEIHQDITERKELDKVKSEFVSLASHQLRTPLTEILLDNESKNLKAEQIKIIKQLSRSSENMISLVNDLLYSSEVESEVILGAKSPGCAVDILEECLKKSKSMAEEKKIKFKTQYPKAKCVKVMINPVLVKKVIQEVINNAIDYSRDRGEVRINVKKNKKDITIIVADDGIGIPRLQQSRIFSKLFRASNAFKVKTHGNGLSLFIAKTIMKKIKGSLEFKSKENKCTTFTIKIPTK